MRRRVGGVGILLPADCWSPLRALFAVHGFYVHLQRVLQSGLPPWLLHTTIIQPLGSFVRLDGRWIRINMDDRTPVKGRRQPGLAAPQELSSYLRASVSICGSVLVFRPTAR